MFLNLLPAAITVCKGLLWFFIKFIRKGKR
jgi:hypothetical protein